MICLRDSCRKGQTNLFLPSMISIKFHAPVSVVGFALYSNWLLQFRTSVASLLSNRLMHNASDDHCSAMDVNIGTLID
jgi:hypothetical protein